MSEGNALSVYRELALVVVDVEELDSADVRIIKARAINRAAVAVHSSALLDEVGLSVARAKGVVIRAELLDILRGYGTKRRANLSVKVGIAAHDINLRAVVHPSVEKRALGDSAVDKSPAVYSQPVVLKVKSSERLRGEDVAVLGKSARHVEWVILVGIAFSGSYDKLNLWRVSELAYDNLQGGVGGEIRLEKVAADKHVVHLALSGELHKLHE